MKICPGMLDVLGGGQTLRTRPRDTAEWLEVARRGVPFAAAEAIKRWLGVVDAVLAELLGIGEKSLSRARVTNARLAPVVSDRLLRVARLSALACEVLEDKVRARGWLKRPQIGLGGRTPLSLLATDFGCAEVERLLLRIEHGVYT